ncbi:MAG: hypothetical protein FD180_1971 [Planctomycetota bacterium]|nr:MAG: hypothetical protein FD180_1971 [Planctomycetota bacterium]
MLSGGRLAAEGCAMSTPAGALATISLQDLGVLDRPPVQCQDPPPTEPEKPPEKKNGDTKAEKIKCTDADKDNMAQIIYSETSGLRGQFKEGTKDYTPESLTQLHGARTAVGHTIMNRKQAGKYNAGAYGNPVKPSDEDLKKDYVKRQWDDCVAAANDACTDHAKCADMGGITHFFIRESTEAAPSDDLKKKWGLKDGQTPAKSFGPFRDQGAKDAKDKSLDFYKDVAY